MVASGNILSQQRTGWSESCDPKVQPFCGLIICAINLILQEISFLSAILELYQFKIDPLFFIPGFFGLF